MARIFLILFAAIKEGDIIDLDVASRTISLISLMMK